MYTYMVECSDGTLYTGWTTDLDNRIATHNSGKGAKYTRSRLPVKLVFFRKFETKSEAMRWECMIKGMSRSEKLLLISSSYNVLNNS